MSRFGPGQFVSLAPSNRESHLNQLLAKRSDLKKHSKNRASPISRSKVHFGWKLYTNRYPFEKHRGELEKVSVGKPVCVTGVGSVVGASVSGLLNPYHGMFMMFIRNIISVVVPRREFGDSFSIGQRVDGCRIFKIRYSIDISPYKYNRRGHSLKSVTMVSVGTRKAVPISRGNHIWDMQPTWIVTGMFWVLRDFGMMVSSKLKWHLQVSSWTHCDPARKKSSCA